MTAFATMPRSYVTLLTLAFLISQNLKALQQELAYATYLNISTAILPPPRNRDHVASYARIVNACLSKAPYINLSVRLPIYNPSVFHPQSPISAFHPASPSGALSPSRSSSTPSLVVSESEHVTPNSGGSLNATWEMWDVIRSMCDYNTRLSLSMYALLCSEGGSDVS